MAHDLILEKVYPQRLLRSRSALARQTSGGLVAPGRRNGPTAERTTTGECRHRHGCQAQTTKTGTRKGRNLSETN